MMVLLEKFNLNHLQNNNYKIWFKHIKIIDLLMTAIKKIFHPNIFCNPLKLTIKWHSFCLIKLILWLIKIIWNINGIITSL